MNAPELALHYQRLDQRAATIRSQMTRLQASLASNPEAERLEERRSAAEAARRSTELQLRAREREVEDRRTRVRGRERELMSGRIRNPTELMKLQQEIDHLKATVGEEEDAELLLMEQLETLETEETRLGRELAALRERSEAAAPELQSQLKQLEAELVHVETDREEYWSELPADWKQAYRRVQSRTVDPIAQVVGNQCQACHVSVTSSGMQSVRRGALLQCDNCGRLLVVA
jgi:predicted  nucleic acid-binding Zn-ribbon protein